MNLDTSYFTKMAGFITNIIEYLNKESLPKEQKVLKKLIIGELMIIYTSLHNAKALIEKLKEQLEKIDEHSI